MEIVDLPEYFNENDWEEKIIEIIEDEDYELSECALSELVNYFEVRRTKYDSKRWTRPVTSLLKIQNNYYIVNWEIGLTELQDNLYWEQPQLVKQPIIIEKIVRSYLINTKDGKQIEFDI